MLDLIKSSMRDESMRNLCAGIFEITFEGLTKCPRNSREYNLALSWLRDDSNQRGIPYRMLCECLGLDADYVRERIYQELSIDRNGKPNQRNQ